MFLGVMFVGPICDRAFVHAQPASEPASNEGGLTPPGDEPTSIDGDSSSDNDSFVVDNAGSPWSQGVSSEDRHAARALLREGARLYLVPLYAKAAEQYAAALRKWKHPAIYYNLALTQRNLGKEVDARENFEHALKYGEGPLGAKRFRDAQKQLAEVNRLLGRLRVICRTPGAEVALNGVTLFIGPGSYEGWIRAKSHELTAKKAGYLPEARRVTVSPQRLQDVELKLVTLSQATDAGRRWATWKPWAVVTAGAAFATAGGLLHRRSFSNFNIYDDGFQDLSCASPMGEPPQVSGCTEEQSQHLDHTLSLANRYQFVAVGSYVIGGSLIAAGVVLLYMNRPRLTEQGGADSSAKNVAILPAVSEASLGVLVRSSY